MTGSLISYSPAEIDKVFAPFVREKISTDDPRWREAVTVAARRQRKLRWKRHIIGSLSRRLRRTQEAVEENYSRQWEALSPEALFGADGGGSRIEWDKNGFLANSNGLKRIHALLMMRRFHRSFRYRRRSTKYSRRSCGKKYPPMTHDGAKQLQWQPAGNGSYGGNVTS